jgi:hypothetical protein
MSRFEDAFGVPAGHRLRLVRSASGGHAGRGRAGAEAPCWEHEEYDRDGRLIAVYESWARAGDGGGVAFVKYSPYGWVLSVSGRSARLPMPPSLPMPPTRHRPVVEAA